MTPDSRIVALLFKRVGDSLLATPALRTLKQCLPNAHLSVIVESGIRRVFEHNPWIDEIRSVDPSPSTWQLINSLSKPMRPDVVLDFLSNPRSALACLISRSPLRVGFACRGRQWVYTNKVPLQNPSNPVYSAIHKLGLVKSLGLSSQDYATDFFLTEQDRSFADQTWQTHQWKETDKVIAFFVHSRRTYKRWPLDNFANVIAKIKQQNWGIPVILMSPDDDSAPQVLQLTGLSEQYLLRTNELGQLAAILSKCSLLVGNDGGPKHLAVAVKTPTVTIFGAEPSIYWTPPEPKHIALSHWKPNTLTDPHAALAQITPAEVLSSISTILETNP